MKPCPACSSPDTVSYWDIKANRELGSMSRLLQEFYPNARKCVDCEHVWWKEPLPRVDFSTIGKAT